MKKHLVLLAGLLCFTVLTGCQNHHNRSQAHFYISPEGSDSFSGKFSDITGNDGPFKTLQRAKEAVRELKKSVNDDIVVMLRDGEYYFHETLVFGLEDSGKDGQSIIYQNYPDENPIISAGIHITGWKRCDNLPPEIADEASGNVWVADAPKSISAVYVLFDGNTRLPRARSKGFFTTNEVKGSPASTENITNRNKIFYKKGDFTISRRIADIELIVIPSYPWTMNILPIESIDEEKGLVTSSLLATYVPGKNRHVKDAPNLWLENDFQYLDEPREWVFDSLTRKIYLWPPKGKKPSERIYAPSITELIKVEGDIQYDMPTDVPVKNIVFKGLTFTKADRYSWKKDTIGWGLQHNWEMFDEPSAMLRFRGVEGCKVLDCVFTNSGAAGVRFDLYAQNNEVSGCQFNDLGGGGVLLAGYGPGTKDVNKHNRIINNEIYNIGTIYWHSLGIWAWQSGENMIANNLIHHTPYSGIAVTGRIHFDKKGLEECSKTVRWDEVENPSENITGYERWKLLEKYLHARNNIVNRNELYKVCDVLGDGNGIYFSGCGTNNIGSENIVHDMTHWWATSVLRTDDITYENVFEKNLVYDCVIPALIMKHENNKFNNNIFVNCGSPKEKYYRRYATIAMRYGPVTGSELKYSIIYNDDPSLDAYEYGETYGQPAHLNQCDADYNLFYCPVNPDWEKDNLAKHQEMGIELHSIVADPMFVDGTNKDFRLKKDSPVLSFPGYQQIPYDEIGLLKD